MSLSRLVQALLMPLLSLLNSYFYATCFTSLMFDRFIFALTSLATLHYHFFFFFFSFFFLSLSSTKGNPDVINQCLCFIKTILVGPICSLTRMFMRTARKELFSTKRPFYDCFRIATCPQTFFEFHKALLKCCF